MDAKKLHDFKMCKKVAELTQVVHMLFQQSNEHEFEISAYRQAYETEIEVIARAADTKSREAAENGKRQAAVLEEKMDELKRRYEEEMRLRDTESADRLKDTERLLAEEKSETEKLRDLLISAQKELEASKSSYVSEVTTRDGELDHLQSEHADVKRRLADLEKTHADSSQHHKRAMRELEASNHKANKELAYLQTVSERFSRQIEELLVKNKELETELKILRREYARQVRSAFNSGSNLDDRPVQNGHTNTTTRPDEVDHLRRELTRYKLELTNRDQNYNRLFSEQHQFVLDSRAAGSGVGVGVGAGPGGLRPARVPSPPSGPRAGRHPAALHREKTFSCVAGQAYAGEPMQMLPRQTTNISTKVDTAQRFPFIHADSAKGLRMGFARSKP